MDFIGYKIVSFSKEDIIPIDAIFIQSRKVFYRYAGWASNLKPVYETIFDYQVPIYKKVRTKK